jgi:predicted ATP-grasp superfamily ATP-dependent carboligase
MTVPHVASILMAPETDRDAAVIPTGFDPGSYSCVRSLSKQGVYTIVASEYDDVHAAASKYCDEFVQIPSPHGDVSAYTDALVDLASRPAVRTVLPLRPLDPYVFAASADEFADHVSLVTPPLDTLETVHDRLALAEAAEAAGVPMPTTKRLGALNGWTADMVVKSRYNLLTDRYVDTCRPGEAETVKDVELVQAGDSIDVEALQEAMHHEPIAQEFVEAEGEYLFGALYDHGEPVATFQHEQLRGDSYTGGGGVYRQSIHDPALESVGRRILDALDYHGLACIEYVKDAETGEYKLVEINPRLWQSLPCAVRAGADFPLYYWLLATGRADDIDPEYAVGVATHLLYGELGYLQTIRSDESPFHERPSLLGETATVAASCLTTPNFDMLRFDDPMPFLRGVGHVVSR